MTQLRGDRLRYGDRPWKPSVLACSDSPGTGFRPILTGPMRQRATSKLAFGAGSFAGARASQPDRLRLFFAKNGHNVFYRYDK